MKSGRALWIPVVSLVAIALIGCSNGSAPTAPTSNTEDTSPPATPSGLHGAQLTSGYALAWDASPSPNVSGYQVYQYSPDPATTTSYVQVGATSASQTWWAFPTDMYGGVWHMRVRAVNPAGNASGLSSEVIVAVPNPDMGGGGVNPNNRIPRDQ
jgi:hypothetical protein